METTDVKKTKRDTLPQNPRLRYIYRHICTVILAVLALVMFLLVWLNYISGNNHTGYLLGYGNISLASFLYLILFLFSGKFMRAFKIGVERQTKQIASIVITVFVTDFFDIFVSITILNNFRYFPDFAWRYALLFLVQSVVLSLATIVMVDLYRRIIVPLPVVIISGDRSNNVEEKLRCLPHKYTVEKIIQYNASDLDLEKIVEDSTSILVDDLPADVENDILKMCFYKGKRVYVIPKLADIILKASDSINVIDTPLYLNRNHGMSFSQGFIKRTVDIVASVLAVIVLSPVFLITMIAIKLEDGGPVLYRQERVTKDNRHFMILKFRSMIVDAEKDGRPHPAGEKDDRITKVGKVIRPFRIDELPQFFNIIAGDMSLVGPRPERYEHVEKYSKEIPEFQYRHKVKGGLTGYAQVYGKYNTTALDKLKLDMMYITNYSLLLDFQIILETFKILFLKESTEGFESERAREMHDADGK